MRYVTQLVVIFSSVCCLYLPTFDVNAELFDRGNGMIYDSDQDLTWLQDANILKGKTMPNGRTTSNGKVSVSEAQAWIDQMNASPEGLKGLHNWRLPITMQEAPVADPNDALNTITVQTPDPNEPDIVYELDISCPDDVRLDTNYGPAVFYERRYGCTAGEMEYLTAQYDPYTNPLFENVMDFRYWTATPYRDFFDPCAINPDDDWLCHDQITSGKRKGFYWNWDFERRIKGTLAGGNKRYVWFVRDGDVTDNSQNPPEPSIASAEMFPDIYVHSIDGDFVGPNNSGPDGTAENVSLVLSFHSISADNQDLYEITQIEVNSGPIGDPNIGKLSNDGTHMSLPSVTYRALNSTQSLSLELDYVVGENLWQLISVINK